MIILKNKHLPHFRKCKRIPDLEKKCKQTLFSTKCKKFQTANLHNVKKCWVTEYKTKSTYCAKKSENQSMICKV